MKERFFCERNDMVKNERIATELRKEDFYYDLPQAQIAQHPAEPRDAARLMVIDRASGEIAHRHFYDILDYIRPEDVLVVNDSKVIPARLYGTDAEKSDRTGGQLAYASVLCQVVQRAQTIDQPRGGKVRFACALEFIKAFSLCGKLGELFEQ